MSDNGSTKYAFVDDQSPRITYSDRWFNEVDVDGAWNKSLSMANTSGSSATFKFNGNRVGVVGYVLFLAEEGAPVSQYMVDDGSPSTFEPSVQLNNTGQTTFFLSPLLADGDHTITFELTSNGTPFHVDYIAYNMSTAVASSTTGGSQPTIVTTIIETPTGAATASGSSSSNLVGPIVGGVVGGITLLVCAFLAIYFLYWKPSRQRANYNYHATSLNDDWDPDTKPLFAGTGAAINQQSSLPYSTAATPYHPPPPSTRSLSVYSTSSESQVQFQNVHSPEPSPALPGALAALPHRNDTASSYSSSAPSVSSTSSRTTVLTLAGTQPLRISPRDRKAAEAGLRDEQNERPLTLHQDSGIRFDIAGPSSQPSGSSHAAEPVPEELPPVYSES